MGKDKTISAVMNVKIDKFQGIYTNCDENSLSLEYFRESFNFRHEEGFAEFEAHAFSRLDRCITLEAGYKWEKAASAIISSDVLSESISQKSYQVLVLVCRKTTLINGENFTERKIFFNEKGSDVFYGLFKEDENPLPNLCISEYDFSSWGDQEVFFSNFGGVLRIYLPHMSFWLGRLERTVYRVKDWTYSNPVNGFYFDRLIEPYNEGDYSVDTTSGIDSPVCKSSRRLGFSTEISVTEDSSVVIGDELLDLSFQAVVNINTSGISRFDMTGYGFYLTSHDTGEFITPLLQYNSRDSKMHVFWREMSTDSSMLIPDEYNGKLKFGDGSSLQALYGQPVYEPHIAPNDWKEDGQSFYRVSYNTFLNDSLQRGLKWAGRTIELTGFSNTVKSADIVVTETLDRASEIIVYKNWVQTDTESARFALKFSHTYLPKDINARVTGFKVYIKIAGYIDYKLCKEVDLLDAKEKDFTTFYITQDSVQDVTLTQNIGFYFDDKSEKYYRPITSLRDVAFERGYSVALSSQNQTSAYFSAAGNGRAMTDIFYPTSVIERLSLNKVTAIAKVNGRFLLFDSSRASVITISGEGIIPVIDVIDSLEYGVKSRHDIAESESGIIINTAKGIFTTNGFEKRLLSEAINDKAERNYTESFIRYNPIRHELLYFPSTCSKPYRYRFSSQKWEGLFLQDTEGNEIRAVDTIIDSEGREILLGEGVFMRSGFNAVPCGMLKSNYSDLSLRDDDKFIDRVFLDIKGSCMVSFFMDARKSRYLFTSDKRKSVGLRFPAERRYPFQKFCVMIETVSESFTLYGMELEISAIKRRTLNETEIKAVG